MRTPASTQLSSTCFVRAISWRSLCRTPKGGPCVLASSFAGNRLARRFSANCLEGRFDQILCASVVERCKEFDCRFGRSSCLPPTVDEPRIVKNGRQNTRKNHGASLESAVVKRRSVEINRDIRKSLVACDHFTPRSTGSPLNFAGKRLNLTLRDRHRASNAQSVPELSRRTNVAHMHQGRIFRLPKANA